MQGLGTPAADRFKAAHGPLPRTSFPGNPACKGQGSTWGGRQRPGPVDLVQFFSSPTPARRRPGQPAEPAPRVRLAQARPALISGSPGRTLGPDRPSGFVVGGRTQAAVERQPPAWQAN